MGALISKKSKQKLVDKVEPPQLNLKPISIDTPELAPIVSPDTDVVNEGVDKIMKKGKASTIMTGMFGDTSQANTYSNTLLGG